MQDGIRPMAHTNEEVVRELYATFGADNREKLAAFFTDDPVWNVPGRSVVPGTHHGMTAIINYFRMLGAVTSGSYRKVELHEVLADEDVVVSKHKSRANIDGEVFFIEEVLTWHLSEGKISEVWEDSDPAWEDLLRWAASRRGSS